MNALLTSLENRAISCPDQTCFRFVDKAGDATVYSLREVLAATQKIAWWLQSSTDSTAPIALDLPNCPSFIFFVLGSLAASRSVVALNQRLTEPEKQARLKMLEAAGLSQTLRINRSLAASLLNSELPRTLGESFSGFMAAHAADADSTRIILFTTGTTGTPKAVPVSTENLIAAAQAASRALAPTETCYWQAALPLYHVGGFQVFLRSLLLGRPFVLYEHFDGARLLDDAARWSVTHCSVVDTMLQDIVAEAQRSPQRLQAFQNYRCLLLGGGPLNQATVQSAKALGGKVFASFGMTETASLIAATLVDDTFDGGLELLEDYEARLLDSDNQGVGLLTVKGPGVFKGYLNANTPRTADGFFITGDRAALKGRKLYIKARQDDIFVSGGENVSPAEIAAYLRTIPGVRDVTVFPVEDPYWTARPVAFIEMNTEEPPLSLWEIRSMLSSQLSPLYRPKHLLFTRRLPRQGIGKIDRKTVLEAYEQRIEISEVAMERSHAESSSAFVDESLGFIRIQDAHGRVGVGSLKLPGENPSAATEYEAICEFLTKQLAPILTKEAFSDGKQMLDALACFPNLSPYPSLQHALLEAGRDLAKAIVNPDTEEFL